MIKRLRLGSMGNIVYLVADPRSKECAVVDPAWDVPAILRAVEAEGWNLRAAVLTHHHFDHSDGVPQLVRAGEVPVFIHEADAPHLPFECPSLRPVREGHVLELGDLSMEFLHTPGHTEGSQCLRVADRLLTGDTLFVGACGRVDLPGSDPRKMYDSLRRLCALSDDLVFLPGHAVAARLQARLGDQKRENRYLEACLRLGPEEFVRELVS